MAPILLYHAFKATTSFVDAFVNERLRQLLPSINDCLLASSPWLQSAESCLLSRGTVTTFYRCGGQVCNQLM